MTISPLYDYSLDSSWAPPENFSFKSPVEVNNQFLDNYTTEEFKSFHSHLKPSRFKHFAVSSLRLRLSHVPVFPLFQTYLAVNFVGLIYLSQFFISQITLSWSAFILTASLAQAAAATHITACLAKYFFSPLPTQKGLEEAFLELKRNPMFLNLYDKMKATTQELEVKLADRQTFGLSRSRAHVLFKDNKTYINIWDGKKTLKEQFTSFCETYYPYLSENNPIIWDPNPISALLFELINMFQKEVFEFLFKQKDLLTKKEFCILIEFIEHQTVFATEQILTYGVNYMGWDINWFKGYPKLEKMKVAPQELILNFKNNWQISLNQKLAGYMAHVDGYAIQWYQGLPLTIEEVKEELSLVKVNVENQPLTSKPQTFPEIEVLYLKSLNPSSQKIFDKHIQDKLDHFKFFLNWLLKNLEAIDEITLTNLPNDYRKKFLFHLVQDYLTDTKQDDQKLTIELFKKALMDLSKEEHRYAKVRWIMGQ